MTGLKTAIIKARVEQGQRQRFQRLGKSRGLTESELLRFLVLLAIEPADSSSAPIAPNAADADAERMTVRMPRFLKKAVAARAKTKGMTPSRWVTALIQSNLTGTPVMGDAELMAVQASSRELAAIGRNINQIAKALNEAFYETERVRLDKLAELSKTITENRAAIRALVRASRNAWEVE